MSGCLLTLLTILCIPLLAFIFLTGGWGPAIVMWLLVVWFIWRITRSYRDSGRDRRRK